MSDVVEFIKNSKLKFGDLLDYSKVQYNGIHKNVTLSCSIHGEFEQRPVVHLKSKCGCPKCGDDKNASFRTLTTDEFIAKAIVVHGDKYDYSKSVYDKSLLPITIICKEHGEFIQRPNDHLNGRGCAKCFFAKSQSEEDLLTYIKSICDYEIIERSKNIISPLELDIYIPELKIAFEFNGLYWHNEINKHNKYHLNKTELCEAQGIHLIHIYEDDWMFKTDIVKSRINNLLNKSSRIYARKCELKEVSFKDAKEFLNNNHLQGNCISKFRYGLFYNGELVSLMTFGSRRKNLGSLNENNGYELLRFCNKLNYTVVGGADKLFKHFISTINPEQIISYADRSWTMNNGSSVYDSLGFLFNGCTVPSYSYIVDRKREDRFGYRKDLLVKNGFDSLKSEHEIMLERKIYRIYNSGNLKYIWK